jgi:glycosyltransferase involved in cell wall biosynthesis
MGAVPEGTWVVVPAYNEGPAIEIVLRELLAVCPQVVVVDDGSSDETGLQARRRAPYVLRHVLNRGQGAALQTGIEFALRRGASYIVTYDADGQHCVEDLPALLGPIVAGECDITLGSRFLGCSERMPPLRRVTLRLAVLFTRLVSRIRLTDAHNGLRAFSRRAAERIQIRSDRMAHASELIDIIRGTGLPFREVPVRVRYTDYSLAKGQSLRSSVRIVFDYLVARVTS